MCLVFAGHPLDLIKVRMQTMVVVEGQPPAYSSAVDCAKKTIAKDGFRGLYKGMTAPLAGVSPIFAVCFWAYDLGKQLERSFLGLAPDAELSIPQIAVAGAFSAIPTTAIMAPGERIKCLLQVDGEAEVPRFKGPGDVVRTLVKEEGVMSVFRGALPTVLRDGFGSMAYFGVYEAIKRGMTPEGSSLSPLAIVSGGGFAGMCNWAIAIPFDTIKSRIQTAPAGTYTGMTDCYRQLIAKEGTAGLFRGIGPALARAFPANAACFLGVEVSLKFLNTLW